MDSCSTFSAGQTRSETSKSWRGLLGKKKKKRKKKKKVQWKTRQLWTMKGKKQYLVATTLSTMATRLVKILTWRHTTAAQARQEQVWQRPSQNQLRQAFTLFFFAEASFVKMDSIDKFRLILYGSPMSFRFLLVANYDRIVRKPSLWSGEGSRVVLFCTPNTEAVRTSEFCMTQLPLTTGRKDGVGWPNEIMWNSSTVNSLFSAVFNLALSSIYRRSSKHGWN